MLKPFTLLLSASFLSSVMVSKCFAGEDDFKQPIQVDSQTQFVDGKNKSSVFKGNVHITQGSLIIDANEVRVDASLGEGQEVFIALGTPARFTQKLDDGERVIATSNEIRYQVNKRTISLNGDSELIRAGSSVSGTSIVYDMINEQLMAESKKDADGPVTTVFRPDTLESISTPSTKDEKAEDTPQ